MKLLLWHWGRRGAGPRYTLELARVLKSRCTLALSLSRQSELFAESEALGLPGWHVDTYHDLPSAALSSLRLPQLRALFHRYLLRENFDVVISTMRQVWSAAILPLPRSCGSKFLLAVHDAEPHPGDSAWAFNFILRREIAASDGIITLSRHVEDKLTARYPLQAERRWIAPLPTLGVSGGEAMAPRRLLGAGRPIRLCFFGRIKAYKGLGLLLEAVEILQRRYPVALCIAGQGSLEPYEAQLKRLDAVELINRWIGEEEVTGILNANDVLIAPYIEASQSGVIPSAYGVGLPVIANPVGGLVEQVQHGKTGLLAREASAAGLAEAVERMIGDPALYARCSAGALEASRTGLSWDHIAGIYLGAAEALTGAGPKRLPAEPIAAS